MRTPGVQPLLFLYGLLLGFCLVPCHVLDICTLPFLGAVGSPIFRTLEFSVEGLSDEHGLFVYPSEQHHFPELPEVGVPISETFRQIVVVANHVQPDSARRTACEFDDLATPFIAADLLT